MSLKGKVNELVRRMSAIRPESGHWVPVGTWYMDIDGKIIPNSGKMAWLPEDDPGGIFLMPKPMNKKQWENFIAQKKHNKAI
jgi:hypothetical protein